MSIKDTAQSIIKSINSGDTLTSVSLSAENFHSDTVKLVSVLVGKKLGGFMLLHQDLHHILGLNWKKPELIFQIYILLILFQ